MREIKHIVLHATSTRQSATVEAIQNGWRALGWRRPGYHRLIRADGTVAELAPYSMVTNGVAGHNAHSIHICYIGGLGKPREYIDNRTPQQIATMIRLVAEAKELFPNAVVTGHKDFPGVTKSCPCFDAAQWWASVDPKRQQRAKPAKK